MVFKKEFVNTICPIPRYVESHDLWIAIASNLYKSNMHIDDQTFKKRMHDSNHEDLTLLILLLARWMVA